MKLKYLPFLILLVTSIAFAQEIRRPTADADTGTSVVTACGTTNTSSLAMPNFYDAGGNSTSSTLKTDSTSSLVNGRVFSGFAAASGSYSALVLKVDSSCAITFFDNGGVCKLEYSLDGGSTFANITAGQATLPAGQDLTALKIRACTANVGNDTDRSTITLTGRDIWTEGTLGSSRRIVRTTVVE